MTKPDANNLGHETSPYLLQHKDNPVHWQPWGPAALARAKRENKPILLSVGYAACHWCHVMAHESFEDADIAGVMNKLYVSIKVDREERPDIDHIYQNALALLGQQGGWPLTMFLTPDGEPFWGGTYFPPTPRYGRPGFTEVLQGVANAFHQTPDKVDTNKQALLQGLAELGRGGRAGRTAARGAGSGEPLGADVADEAARALLRAVDMAHGGFGGAPKFPQVSGLELLWGAGLRTGDRAFQFAVSLTAERMCQGGIYDHLGGGFARYAVDDRWLVPHFEKMLYDNAALVGLLTELWRETGDTLFRERVEETVAWLAREMLVEGGGFASSLDADSEHEEGKFYVWTESEIDAVLRRDADIFKRAYDVTHEGNWEGHTILNRLKRPIGDEDEEARLAGLRAKLLEARAPRVRPGRDDKVLADWNGQMIAALAEAAFAFEKPAWRALAERAFAFVVERMTLPDGRLAHSYREGRRTAMAVLDDYAHMARAALALHATTGEEAYLARAQGWVAVADRLYWDAGGDEGGGEGGEGGGYFFTAADAEALIVRTKATLDSPSPSGNAIMAEVLTRLFHLTGEEAHRERAEATFAAFAEEARNNVYGHAALLNAAAAAERTVQVAVVGERGRGDTQALLRAVAGVSLPARVLSVIAPSAALPAGHPAAGKGQEGGKATAYVCVGPVCSLPVTDRGALAEALRAANMRG